MKHGWFGFHDPSKFGRLPDPPEPPDTDPELEVGDWIKCKDRDHMIMTMHDLADEGIETEFRYQRNGKPGLWLEVISIE